MLSLAIGDGDPITTVGGTSDDLEPAVLVAHVDKRAVGRPPGAGVVAVGPSDDLALAACCVHEGDLRCRQVVERLLPGHGELGPVG